MSERIEALPDSVTDITPQSNPISTAREMLRLVQEEPCIAAFYVVIHENGDIEYDGGAVRAGDLIWGLERFKAKVLNI